MTYLNEKNKKTEKIIHLMITSICKRNCKYCCNKQYDLSTIPIVTDSELQNSHTLCLTGGEPFAFSNPCEIALYYKRKYKNIKNIYVYTNAYEFAEYLESNSIGNIDGVNVSIKTKEDVIAFNQNIKDRDDIKNLKSNILYVFDNLYTEAVTGFVIKHREWQSDFKPANDSIFRRI